MSIRSEMTTISLLGERRGAIKLVDDESLSSTNRSEVIIGRVNRSKSLYGERRDSIKPQNKITYRNSHSAITFNPNPQEWNNYETQKRLRQSLDVTKVEIEDERLLEVYLKRCEIRDSVPKIPKTYIAHLKSRDPIFAKRYRQVYEARICNEAPSFDHTDNDFAQKVAKYDLTRLKKRILNEAANASNEKTKMYKREMMRANERVKRFLSEMKETQLCG